MATDIDRVALNKRAARLDGWVQYTCNAPSYQWVSPDLREHRVSPPDYCGDSNLVRTRLLPLVANDQWISLDHKLTGLFYADEGPITIESQWFLTADPAVLVQAVCEVLDPGGAD